MKLVENLLLAAELDIDLLRKNRDLGDDPEIPRDIDFILYAKDEARAQLICDFVSDNRYGKPSYEKIELADGSIKWRLLIVIMAPPTDHVLCTLSAFMACLAKLYDLEYDGWGCVIKKSPSS